MNKEKNSSERKRRARVRSTLHSSATRTRDHAVTVAARIWVLERGNAYQKGNTYRGSKNAAKDLPTREAVLEGFYLPLRRALTGRDHGPDMAAFMPFLKRETKNG